MEMVPLFNDGWEEGMQAAKLKRDFLLGEGWGGRKIVLRSNEDLCCYFHR